LRVDKQLFGVLIMNTASFEKEGDARSLSAKIAVVAGSGAELAEWMRSTEKGLPSARSMTIQTLNPKGVPLRTFNLFDCFPTGFTANRDLPAETLTVKISRIEFR
jgi:hypothetical protein